MLLVNGKLFIDGAFYPYAIRIENGQIAEVGQGLQGEDTVDLAGRMVFPGFIDTHIHGFCGHYCGESPESMREICAALPRHGVTAFMPTPLADGSEKALKRIANIRGAIGCPGAEILGMFLYSPYKNRSISYYAPPARVSREGTLQLAGGSLDHVRAILVAPELDPDREWISWVAGQGILPVIGFSEGRPEDIADAVAKGARLTDHFPNGFPPIDHHACQAVVQCLMENDLYMQLTPDCIHVSSNFIRLMLRLKGEDHILAVSDSSPLLGYPEGEYDMDGKKVIKKDGAIRDVNGKLVTGAHFYDEDMRIMLQNGFSVNTIGRLFSENAAKAFGLKDRGLLTPGRRADLVVMNDALEVQQTMIGGKWVYTA